MNYIFSTQTPRRNVNLIFEKIPGWKFRKMFLKIRVKNTFYNETNDIFCGGVFMLEKIKTFWKDYWEVQLQSWNWLKKHWLGYVVLCLIVFTAEICWIFRYSIKGYFEDKLTKKCVEREEEEL